MSDALFLDNGFDMDGQIIMNTRIHFPRTENKTQRQQHRHAISEQQERLQRVVCVLA